MKIKLSIAILAMATSVPLSAETLDNNAVMTLTSMGLGDEAIIAKIKSSESSYDLSTDQMIALKAKGVSGPVIAAMITASSKVAAPAISIDSPDPMVPHPAGVYLLADWLPQPKMSRIDATVTSQAKTGGILGYALTGGIASLSVKAAIQNDTARTKAATSTPVFYFFFSDANPGAERGGGAWLAGTAATISSPNELTLIRLMKKDGRREARVGSVNIGGAKSGVMDKDRIAFDYEMVRPGVFRAKPQVPLAPGEYGFIYSISGAGTAGALNARIFDFSVS